MDSPTDDDRREDELMRRAFVLTGRRSEIDPAALVRAEQVFRRALAPVVERRQRQRRARAYSRWSLAAACVVALGIAWLLPRSNDPVVGDDAIAAVVGAKGPVELLGTDAHIERGIHVGQVLLTGPDGRASLKYHDADVRLDVATSVRFEATRLVLQRGAVYVDTDDQRAGEPNVLIETRFGMVGHTGTQFVARVDDDALTVGVREGTVFVKAGSDRRDLTATGHGATLASVGSSGSIDVREAPAFDGIWAWVPRASPGFSTDGRSVDAYLDWLSHEYGYSISYRNAATVARAKATQLHGDLASMPVADALDAVSATTDLTVDFAAGEVAVASKGDHDPDGRHERH
jgi:ferric-dicitrate binding protein FerR (iron transport regulator)